jgi:hypothetical protein
MPKMDEATGYSDSYSFGEALRNAVNELPPVSDPYPDQLFRTEVVAVGSEQGGFAGFDRLYVRVRRLPGPAWVGVEYLSAGDATGPLGVSDPERSEGEIPFPIGFDPGLRPGGPTLMGGEWPFPDAYRRITIAEDALNGLRRIISEPSRGRRPPAPERIMSVAAVTVDTLESRPPRFVLSASGSVSSSGWTRGRLRPMPMKEEPKDGIYQFEFLANPPSGIVLPVISPISTERPAVWRPEPPTAEVKGIRVFAAQNDILVPAGDFR